MRDDFAHAYRKDVNNFSALRTCVFLKSKMYFPRQNFKPNLHCYLDSILENTPIASSVNCACLYWRNLNALTGLLISGHTGAILSLRQFQNHPRCQGSTSFPA